MPPFLKKIRKNTKRYVLRLNRFVIFNRLRMFVYRKVLKMSIGENTMIWAGNIFVNVKRFRIGRNSIVGPNNVFLTRGGIEIGENVNLSGFSFFISQHHDMDDPGFKTILKPIVIEDDVWVATHAMILSGVTVGKGAVVGAGAVVTKDVPPYKLVAGNPARVIRDRSQETDYALNSMKGIKWL